MASRIEQVTVENSRLHSELRKSLEMRIDQATQSASAGGKRGSDGTMKNVVGTLQQQLEMVTEDRDNYRDLLRKTTNELEIMQKSDQVSCFSYSGGPYIEPGLHTDRIRQGRY